MTTAALLRHAAMSLAGGKHIDGGAAFTCRHAALLERIFRTTYMLPTLTRHELIREGHDRETSGIAQAARERQASLPNELEIPRNVDP